MRILRTVLFFGSASLMLLLICWLTTELSGWITSLDMPN